MFKNLIGIHSVPRSGSSWCAQIINSHPDIRLKFQPLFSYAFKDRLSLNSDDNEIISFFQEIYLSDDYFINMRDPEIHKNYPNFEKNTEPQHLAFKHVRYHYLLPHLLKKIENLKLILIIRDPIEVLNSWINAPREFYAEWNIENEWRNASLKNANRKEEYFGFEKWKEAALLFVELQKHNSNSVMLINYSDLAKHPLIQTKAIFDFLGLDLCNSTLNFIQESTASVHHEDPNSVFKSKQKIKSRSLSLTIEKIIREETKKSGLENFLNPI